MWKTTGLMLLLAGGAQAADCTGGQLEVRRECAKRPFRADGW